MITQRIESTGWLEAKSDDELQTIYKEVCEAGATPCPREQMIERILIVLATKKPRGPAKKERKVTPKTPVRAPKYSRADNPGRPHQPFNQPPRPGPRVARPKSRRAIVLALCLRPEGTTIQEVIAATGKTLKEAYHDIRNLNRDMGYGLREDENGRIHAYG